MPTTTRLTSLLLRVGLVVVLALGFLAVVPGIAKAAPPPDGAPEWCPPPAEGWNPREAGWACRFTGANGLHYAMVTEPTALLGCPDPGQRRIIYARWYDEDGVLGAEVQVYRHDNTSGCNEHSPGPLYQTYDGRAGVYQFVRDPQFGHKPLVDVCYEVHNWPASRPNDCTHQGPPVLTAPEVRTCQPALVSVWWDHTGEQVSGRIAFRAIGDPPAGGWWLRPSTPSGEPLTGHEAIRIPPTELTDRPGYYGHTFAAGDVNDLEAEYGPAGDVLAFRLWGVGANDCWMVVEIPPPSQEGVGPPLPGYSDPSSSEGFNCSWYDVVCGIRSAVVWAFKPTQTMEGAQNQRLNDLSNRTPINLIVDGAEAFDGLQHEFDCAVNRDPVKCGVVNSHGVGIVDLSAFGMDNQHILEGAADTYRDGEGLPGFAYRAVEWGLILAVCWAIWWRVSRTFGSKDSVVAP